MENLIHKLKKHDINIDVVENHLRLEIPKNFDDDTILDEVKANKEELILYIEKVKNAANFTAIRPCNSQAYYLLSSAQKRLYFLYEFDKESLAYNMPLFLRLSGSLDKLRLERAFSGLIERHESLRTFFELLDGNVVQKVADHVPFELDYYNLEQEDEEAIIEGFIRPFDLGHAPLVRIGLIELSDQEHLLLLDMHHIVTDGVSSGILIKDFMYMYNGDELPELNLHYKDYAVWQQSENNQTAISDQRKFWLDQFSNEVPTMTLPTDFRRPAIKDSKGNTLSFKLSSEETFRLKKIAKEEGATLFMVLLAIYNVLLSKLSGEEDIVVGTPIAGRQHVDLDNMVGMFVNTLALRNYPKGHLGFNEFLDELRTKTLSCFDNQDYQYEELIEDLQLDRDTSHNPLFDVFFSLENIEDVELSIPGLTLKPMDRKSKTSWFDLALSAIEKENGLVLVLEYATSLFKRETTERFASYFKKILSAITDNPSIKILDIHVISEDEEQLLLKKFNDTLIEYPKDKTIITCFEEQVMKTPDRVALVFKDIRMSYKELNEAANQIGNYLRDNLQIMPEDIIGLQMERSERMIIAVLGILKSGAAYLPIDKSCPLERLDYMLYNSNARFLIGDESRHDVSVISKCDTKFLSFEECQSIAIHNPKLNNYSNNLAYVIYTSGSTGNPKGVMIENISLVNLATFLGSYYNLKSTDTVLQFASLSFDMSVEEIFPYLIIGASIHLRNDKVLNSTKDFLFACEKWRISILNLPTPYWNQITQDMEKFDLRLPKCVRLVSVGGEALNLDTALTWIRRHGDYPELINGYGPTEATVLTTMFRMTANHLLSKEINSISIGSPIANLSLYVLNEYLGAIPLGVTGELCIGGVQVARGYLNRPDLTAEKFVPSPFVEGERIYRTGDLGRWLPDGTIEFMGRKDNQVKIRGYRIELGEIESVLEQLDGIGGAAVLALDDSAGTKQLVGYIVPNGDAFDEALVIGSLQERLPDYMVPRIYIELDAFPLTVNGKVDRKALPAPDLSERAKGSYVPPTTAIERELVSIWEGILGISPIGVASNFFELGGDSIKAIQLMSRSNMAGLHFKVKDIFKYQTISELSRNLEGPREVISENGVLEGVLDLLPIQSEFFATGHAKSDHYNQSVLLEIPDTVTVGDLSKAVERLAFHHDALRLQYVLSDDEVVQSYGSSVPALIEERATKKRDITSICKEYQSSLDLVKGEVCRFVHVDMGKDRNRLFVVAHHLCVDGVSWRILLEDLESILQGLQKGKEVKLPAKGTSYRQWADRLKGYAQKISRSSEVGYWEDILSRYKEFPQDHNSDIALTYGDTAHHEQVLDSESTKSLLHDVHQAYGTEINDVLLSALGTALTGHSGSGEVVVAMEGHGREELFEDADIGRTVGWFTSMYPVLLKNHGDIAEQLKETKDMLRDVPNKGIGYGLLRYMSGDDVARGSLEVDYGSVLFNYLGSFDNSLDDQGLLGHSSDSRGEDIGISNLDPHGISVNGMIIDGELRTSWSYDPNRYDAATVEGLAKGYGGALVSIIDHCRGRGRETTRSDYGLSARIDNKSLSSFKAEMSKDVSPIVDIYGLSPLQEGMLFHNLYEDGSMSYVGRFNCDFLEGMDVDLFKQSWEHLMSHHSVLRTGIHADYFDTPVQYVHEAAPLSLTEVDYSNLGTEDLEQALESYMEAEYLKGFDLKEPPLFGFSLVHLPGGSTRLFMKSHHILWDGWSLSILMGQFVNCYDHLSKGDSLPVIRSSDYGRFVRELGSRDKTLTKSYWCSYLKELEGSVFLPFIKDKQDRNQVFGNVSDRLDLEKDLVKDLVSYAQRHRLTMNTIVQGAWSYLLSRYTGSSTVVFGATVSGRDHSVPDIENEVGLYINTLPVCTEVPYEEGLSSWLSSLQEGHTKGREEYGHVSLGDVQGWMDIQGPMFDSLLVFENYPVDEKLLGSTGLKVENVGMSESTNYVLTLGIKHAGEDLSIRFDYNDILLDPEVVRMIKGHMCNVLESMTSNPETLGDLSYMSEEENNLVLRGFNDTKINYSKNITVLDFFAENVKNNPSQIALVFEEDSLTYEELNNKSDALAHYLLNNGIIARSLVPIFLERSFEMVVGILGILKIGAAYVPIDPTYPPQRISYILEDIGAEIILTRSEHISSLSENISNELPLVFLDTDAPYKNSLTGNLPIISDSDLIYIIYTSGTTGTPKGVMNEHRGVLNRLIWMRDYLEVSTNEVILQKTTFCFDVSVWELLLPLITGCRMVLATPGGHRDSFYLQEFIVKEGVTIGHFVPSMLTAFLSELMIGYTCELRHIICSGEELKRGLVIDFDSKLGKVKLHNLYGPTEAAIDVTAINLDDYNEDIVPIGKPIANTVIYIVDRYNSPQPIGTPGELLIGGVQVARGYLNLPKLTKERFIPSPFVADQLLYRTGDLAKWLPDGNIAYLGRNDSQVKILGHRIEIGEIESVLESLTLVEQAAVILGKNTGGLQWLIAYVKCNKAVNMYDIEEALREKLPDYMVPRHYVELETIPLNRNGKVDYSALPEFEMQLKNEYERPSTEIEEKLVAIWSDLLELDKESISVTESFFRLGGHSIKMITLLNLIRKDFNVKVKLETFYKNPQIRELGKIILVSSLSVDNLHKESISKITI